jgi:murein DD-endopeptidase MepM/ murein hydrolase activator NlpD
MDWGFAHRDGPVGATGLERDVVPGKATAVPARLEPPIEAGDETSVPEPGGADEAEDLFSIVGCFAPSPPPIGDKETAEAKPRALSGPEVAKPLVGGMDETPGATPTTPVSSKSRASMCMVKQPPIEDRVTNNQRVPKKNVGAGFHPRLLRADRLKNGRFPANPPFHRGVDISLDRGTDVYAFAPGLVLTAFNGASEKDRSIGDGRGNWVEVCHTCRNATGDVVRQWLTIYMHLQSVSVQRGQRLVDNLLIGKSGATGNSQPSDPHVHVETWEYLTRDQVWQRIHGDIQELDRRHLLYKSVNDRYQLIDKGQITFLQKHFLDLAMLVEEKLQRSTVAPKHEDLVHVVNSRFWTGLESGTLVRNVRQTPSSARPAAKIGADPRSELIEKPKEIPYDDQSSFDYVDPLKTGRRTTRTACLTPVDRKYWEQSFVQPIKDRPELWRGATNPTKSVVGIVEDMGSTDVGSNPGGQVSPFEEDTKRQKSLPEEDGIIVRR